MRNNYSNKNLTFFAVMKKDDLDHRPITLVSSIADAREYVERLIQVDHFEHFKSWAELRELDLNSDEAWNTYADTCVDPKEWANYVIAKMHYKHSDVAAMLRIFAHAVPLGCSYENSFELEKFKAQLEIKKSLIDAWDKAVKDKSLDKVIKEAKEKAKKELEDIANDEVAEDESE